MRTKLDLLKCPVWTYREVGEYLGVQSKTTAIRIKQRAIDEKGGAVPYGTKYVKTESVLALFGTTRADEIALWEKTNEKEEITAADTD